MCTVSIVPTHGGVRLVCNRDERLSRAAAQPPAIHRTAAGLAIYPVDPQSGGTWIGVTDRGFAAVLLNRTPLSRGHERSMTTSRGAIVPFVLGRASLRDAIDAATRLERHRFDPFELIVLTPSRVVVFSSTGGVRHSRSDSPLLFTSSSLGDDLVEPPRRALFDSIVAAANDQIEGQRRFHRHQWPEARPISVHMWRHGAATVSRTTVDLSAHRMCLRYEPVATADTRGPARAA